MRILFTFPGGSGHLDPLVPIARAAAAAGHAVAFTGRPAMVAAIEAAGFPAFASGVDVASTPERLALGERYRSLPTIAEREELLLREGFAGIGARSRATDLLALCAAWQPDLLVCEELEFGGMVIAEHGEARRHSRRRRRSE